MISESVTEKESEQIKMHVYNKSWNLGYGHDIDTTTIDAHNFL